MTSGSAPFGNVGQSSDPTKFLAYLEKASDNVQKVGTDTVNGVEATHYHATIDLGKRIDAAKVPPALREHVRQLWTKSGVSAPTLPVDVWVDGEGRVVRMKMDMDLSAYMGGVSGTSGATAPTITMTLDLSKFGEPVTVTAPPADQVVDLKDLAKKFGINGRGAFGNLGGTSGGGTSGVLGVVPGTKSS